MALVVLVVLLAVGLMVTRLGGPDAMATRLAAMQPAWLAAAGASMVCGLMLAGPRFLALLPHGDWRRPGALATGSLLVASTVLNLSFPGPAGELAIATALNRRYGVPTATALASSLHGRFSGLGASGLLVLLLLPLVDVPDQLVPMLWGLGGLLGVAGLGVGLIALRPRLLSRIFAAAPRTLARHLPGRLGVLMGKLADGVDKIAHDLAVGARVGMGPWLQALGWSLLSHACFGAGVILSGLAVGLHLPVLPALVAHAASVVASVALIVMPGGLGAWDATFGGVLVMAAHLTWEQAALVIVAVRITQTLGLLASGAAFLGWSGALLAGRPDAQRS